MRERLLILTLAAAMAVSGAAAREAHAGDPPKPHPNDTVIVRPNEIVTIHPNDSRDPNVSTAWVGHAWVSHVGVTPHPRKAPPRRPRVSAAHAAELARLRAEIKAYSQEVYAAWTITRPATAAEAKRLAVIGPRLDRARRLYREKAARYGAAPLPSK